MLTCLVRQFIMATVLPFALICPLKAGVIFTLDAPVSFGAPGTVFDVTGSLSNPDIDPVFLNTASGSLSSGDLDFDYTNYFVLVPRTLNGGELYSGPIFSIVVSLAAQPGDYFGSFTIQGGIDENAFDELTTQNFQVAVSDTSSVPEPASMVLVFSGLALLLLNRRYPKSKH